MAYTVRLGPDEVVELTDEDIQKTRQYYADGHDRDAYECENGIGWYEGWEEDRKARNLEFIARKKSMVVAGEWDNTVAFAQCAVWLKTGVCYPIL